MTQKWSVIDTWQGFKYDSVLKLDKKGVKIMYKS